MCRLLQVLVPYSQSAIICFFEGLYLLAVFGFVFNAIHYSSLKRKVEFKSTRDDYKRI